MLHLTSPVLCTSVNHALHVLLLSRFSSSPDSCLPTSSTSQPTLFRPLHSQDKFCSFTHPPTELIYFHSLLARFPLLGGPEWKRARDYIRVWITNEIPKGDTTTSARELKSDERRRKPLAPQWEEDMIESIAPGKNPRGQPFSFGGMYT